MTGREDTPDEFGDARVSRAYRESSNERTPPELDRSVLREAASRGASRRGRQPSWFRPVAFAATLVFGVALLFEMQSETGLAPSSPVNGLAPPASDRSDERRMRDAPATSENIRPSSQLNMPASVAAPEESPVAPPKQGNLPANASRWREAAEMKAGKEVPGPGLVSNSDEAQQSLQDLASAAAESATGLSQVSKRGVSERTQDEERYCSAKQTAVATAWWRCVEALRSAGDTVEADRELERLRERFPDFEPDS